MFFRDRIKKFLPPNTALHPIIIGLAEPPKHYGKNVGTKGTGTLYIQENELIIFYIRNKDNDVVAWSGFITSLIAIFLFCWPNIYTASFPNYYIFVLFLILTVFFQILIRPKPIPFSIDMTKYRLLFDEKKKIFYIERPMNLWMAIKTQSLMESGERMLENSLLSSWKNIEKLSE